ncbi:hypothetical protein B0H11DRAFT_2281795 [Mycena galericulata]|nr:hypothetical protein B0H11DRAFT_2281795 [Mycena galericulata]
MHPLFDARKLAQLPRPLRICATKVRTILSENNVEEYLRVSQGIRLSHTLLLLPVYFAHLEIRSRPSEIITVKDNHGTPTPQFQAACTAIEGMKRLLANQMLDSDVCLELWPRFFRWVEIREKHVWKNPREDLLGDLNLHLSALSFIPKMLSHPPVRALASQTSGVRGFLTRAWILFLDHQEIGPEFKLTIGDLLDSFMDASRPENLREVMDSSGGSLWTLSELLVKTVSTATSAPGERSDESEFDRTLVGGVLRFASQALQCEPSLRHALSEEGFIQVLVQDLISSAADSVPEISPLQSRSYAFISQELVAVGHPDLIRRAIASDILIAILSSVFVGAGDGRDHREVILRDILPGYLAYYSVLDGVESSMLKFSNEVKLFSDAPHVRDGPLGPIWRSFCMLATERLELMTWWDRNYVSLDACDNMKAGVLLIRIRIADYE